MSLYYTSPCDDRYPWGGPCRPGLGTYVPECVDDLYPIRCVPGERESSAVSVNMATGDSDDEYEAFQITEEEFLPKRRKMTKEDHIYGLWAEHDSDEDDR